jgi:probable HAF family extracellular repeat protein
MQNQRFRLRHDWSCGSVINLGGLPGFADSDASGINDAGQVVGLSLVAAGNQATEWSGGNAINLGGFPNSQAVSINDAGQAVGYSGTQIFPVPEPSTWAMMLAGFAGLGLAGYRRAKALGPVSTSSAD